MKLVFATAVIAIASAVAVAQNTTPKDAPPASPGKPTAPETPPAAVSPSAVGNTTIAEPAMTVDAANQKEADALLAEVAKAYKNAKFLTDTVKMDIQTPMGPQNQEISIIIGAGNEAFMGMGPVQFTAVGEKLFMTREDVPDKFFSAKLEGDMFKTLESISGQPAGAPVQFALRTGGDSTEERLKTLTMGMLENPKLTGLETAKTDDGAAMQQVNFAGDNGKGNAVVNPETKLIHKVHIEFASQGFDIKADMAMTPKIHETLPTPIAFNPGDRKSVDTLEALVPTPIEVGQVPPDFTLPTLSGEMVTLSKLKGSIVVLDFWATWCPPCKKGLPLLQEFATWAAENAKDVKVFAVDVMERTKTPEETKKKVEEFWTANKYTMGMVIDIDKKVFPKYGFDGIPVTLIIGADGKIAAIHAEGFDPDMVNILKAEVEKVRKGAG